MRIPGKQNDRFRSIRPERTIHEELIALLTEIEADRLPEGILVLVPKRRLRKRSYIALFIGLIAALAVTWNTFALLRGVDFALPYTIETVIEALIVIAAVVVTIQFDLRRRDPKKRIVVTPEFLVSLGDEMGIQWAGAWEVESLTAEGMGGDDPSRPAPSIQMIFKNGDVEDIFLDPALEGREVREWLRLITDKFEYESR